MAGDESNNNNNELFPDESRYENETKPHDDQKLPDDTRGTIFPNDIRSSVGQGVAQASDLINHNLLTVRYAAFASIGLLAAYGLSQTPLFFRYRTVAEIPSSMFRLRRSIKGRLIKVAPQVEKEPIRCYIRHLSPMERILPKALYDQFIKLHPASLTGKRSDESDRQLLLVEIAGLVAPPTDYFSYSEKSGQWLESLAREKTIVSCQLLGRRVKDEDTPREKRSIPDWKAVTVSLKDQVAVSRLYFRSRPFQVIPMDLAESMVRFGRANVCSDGLFPQTGDGGRLVDTTDSLKVLRRDVSYLSFLSRAEYDAARESNGMWADANVRDANKDIVEEVEFQTKATFWEKAWRWLRGG